MDTERNAEGEEHLRNRQRAAMAELARVRRERTLLEAQEMQHLAELYSVALKRGIAADTKHGVELSMRSIQAEIAAAHRVSDRTVARWLSQADDLTEFPVVFQTFRDGHISKAHALTLVRAGEVIDTPEARTYFETTMTPLAKELSVGRLRQRAERLAEQLTSSPLPERHESAMERRCVSVHALPDGMAELTIYTSAAVAEAIHERITKLARRVWKKSDEMDLRTRSNLSADIATDLLLTGSPTAHDDGKGILGRINANITITVPALGLLPESVQDKLRNLPELQHIHGLHGSPELHGYGPISDEIARLFTAHNRRWNLATVNPATGQVLTVDGYRPSSAQRKFLTARDMHCRFPGCITPVRKADLDHTLEAANGGSTSTDNLAYLCRRHHTLKHHEIDETYRWKVTQLAGGTLEWESPAGHTYVDEPLSRVIFKPVHSVRDRAPDDEPAPF